MQSLRSFVRAASKCHPHLQCAKISDMLWSLYTLGVTKAHCQSEESQVKTLVSCVGRQPNSEVWVFSPIVHVDIHGRQIEFCDQEYYW